LTRNQFRRRALAALSSFQRFRLSRPPGQNDAARPRLEKADERYAIVPQPPEALKAEAPPASGALPPWGSAALRATLAGVLVLAIAGFWMMRADDVTVFEVADAARAEQQAVPTEGASNLLGLVPTFTPTVSLPQEAATAPAGAEALAVPLQVVIVTPTPKASRGIAVAGTIVDRPVAMAGGEQNAFLDALQPAMAGLAPVDPALLLPQPAFDLSSIVVPPIAEEVLSAPLARVEIIPLPGLEPIPTAVPTAVAVVAKPTPPPQALSPVRKWSDFQPAVPEQNDHFWVGSAFIADQANQIGAPSYQFGSTGGGRYRPHHCLDIANPHGTPVLSGVTGEVIHSGMVDPLLIGPYNNFYGNTVVIRLDQKLTVGGGEMDVFLLYGHLSQVTVETGQRVQPTDVVGAVGMTGIAIGPHLHVELRVGENSYQHSVNPYLWLKPLPGNGAVAVRLLTADGRSWPGQRLTLARFENGQAVWGRMIETYLDNENIGPNPSWGENGAMGDVPAGYYVLVGNVAGESIRTEFFVREGQTTFVEVRTKQ